MADNAQEQAVAAGGDQPGLQEAEDDHHRQPIINHAGALSRTYRTLLESNEFSDITLVVGGRNFHVHRLVLMARSDYFRAMFSGNFREAKPENNKVVLHTPLPEDDAPTAFKHLLGYIYSGKLDPSELEHNVVQNVLLLADLYGFVDLRQELEKNVISLIADENIFPILQFSKANSLEAIYKNCLTYIDTHFCGIMNNFLRRVHIKQQFESLSEEILCDIIERKTLEVPEIRLVAAVDFWVKADLEKRRDSEVRKHLRLYLIRDEDLLDHCQKLGVGSDMILEAMRFPPQAKRAVQQAIRLLRSDGALICDKVLKLKPFYRGFVVPDVNLADRKHDVAVKPEHASLLDGCPDPPGYVRDPTGCIGIIFLKPFIINMIKMKLFDDNNGGFYSYRVEAYDFEKKGYVILVDYLQEACRSWQTLYFAPVFTGLMRIVGASGSGFKDLRLSKLECYLKLNPLKVKLKYIVPVSNVATEENGAWVRQGNNLDKMLNPEYAGYNGPESCTTALIGEGIVVQLSQPYMISSLSFLLLDTFNRSYAYRVEVGTDLMRNPCKWTLVADTGDKMMKSSQVIQFEEQPVTFIKITGTKSSHDTFLHVVHFECPASQDELSRDAPPEMWHDFFVA